MCSGIKVINSFIVLRCFACTAFYSANVKITLLSNKNSHTGQFSACVGHLWFVLKGMNMNFKLSNVGKTIILNLIFCKLILFLLIVVKVVKSGEQSGEVKISDR